MFYVRASYHRGNRVSKDGVCVVKGCYCSLRRIVDGFLLLLFDRPFCILLTNLKTSEINDDTTVSLLCARPKKQHNRYEFMFFCMTEGP